MSNTATATDWAVDVKRYVPAADNGAIVGLVRHCLVSQKTRETPLVSFAKPAETRSVRENFCKKTLGLTDSDGALDAAIASVGTRMSDTTSRHRVTAYYLLAEHFGKLEQFVAAAAANPSVPAAPPLAPWAATMFDGPPPGTASGAPSDDIGFAALVGLTGAALALFAAIASNAGDRRFDTTPLAPAAAAPAAVAELAAPAIPEGAGIVSEVVEGRPKVSVYFAVGTSDVAPDFVAAVAPVKAWLDANPNDRVQLSGFSDPTGDAAANAELAKSRAQGVAAALSAAGVAAERIDLVKPADSSDEAVDLAGARRVEITVTPG
jgi:outer membrane protein OmpA-like peptidoglycan-associated protein